MMKKCSKCKSLKQLSYFHKSKKHLDGYNSVCKECKLKKELELSRQRSLLIESKICSQCGIEKNRSDFSLNRWSPDGMMGVCTLCKTEFLSMEFIVNDVKTEFKKCSLCNELKHISEFHKHKGSASKLDKRCKQCRKANDAKSYIDNRDVINKRNTEYTNRVKFTEEYKIKTRLRAKEYLKIPENLIKKRLRDRIYNVLTGHTKKSKSTMEILGISIEDFKKYIESKFDKNMNWDNYGSYWHIDHRIPCSKFDLNDPLMQAQCFHYTNMQPMEAKENLRKHNSLIGNTQMGLLL